MLHGNIRASQLNGAAGAVVEDELDLVGTRKPFDQDMQLLQHAEAGVVVRAGDYYAEDAPSGGGRIRGGSVWPREHACGVCLRFGRGWGWALGGRLPDRPRT